MKEQLESLQCDREIRGEGMSYITPNQYANMLEKRAKDLQEIAARMRGSNLVFDAIDVDLAVIKLESAAKSLRARPQAGGKL